VRESSERRRFLHDGAMPERLLEIGVECYAGHRGEQTLRALILADHRIAVADVLDAWLAPDHRYFKLKGEDGHIYAVLRFGVLALHDGTTLGDGSVTTVVTGHVGPIAIGAYTVKLADGGRGADRCGNG
jgi:hypothetical protein